MQRAHIDMHIHNNINNHICRQTHTGAPTQWTGAPESTAQKQDFPLHLQCMLKMILRWTFCPTDTKPTVLFEVVSDLWLQLTPPVTKTQTKY